MYSRVGQRFHEMWFSFRSEDTVAPPRDIQSRSGVQECVLMPGWVAGAVEHGVQWCVGWLHLVVGALLLASDGILLSAGRFPSADPVGVRPGARPEALVSDALRTGADMKSSY